MKDELRFRLFSELVGNDERSCIRNYDTLLRNSEAYNILSYNIIDCRNSKTRKAKAIVYSYDSLSFKPKNVQDAFKLEILLNYLTLHSFPEYYINPLSISPEYQGEVNSIGNLYIDYRQGEKTINEIILDDNESLETKKEQVHKAVQYWEEDMFSTIQDSLRLLRKSIFWKSDKKTLFLFEHLESFLFILFNFTLFFFIVYPFEEFQILFFSPRFDRLTGYAAFIYPIFTLLYDIIFIIFHSIRANIMEPFRYAKRFLKKSEFKIYQDVQEKADNLYDYIYGAIKNRILLKNDILNFSMLSSSYIDYKAILGAEEKKKSKKFLAWKGIHFSFTLLEALFFVLALSIYLFDLIFSTVL